MNYVNKIVALVAILFVASQAVCSSAPRRRLLRPEEIQRLQEEYDTREARWEAAVAEGDAEYKRMRERERVEAERERLDEQRVKDLKKEQEEQAKREARRRRNEKEEARRAWARHIGVSVRSPKASSEFETIDQSVVVEDID